MSKGFRSFFLPVVPFMVLFFCMSCTAVNSGAPLAGAVSAGTAANTIEGEISLIEVDGTVLVRSASGEAVVIEPQVDTKVIRNEQPGKADQLKPGDKVWVRYLPDSHKAMEIRATGKD